MLGPAARLALGAGEPVPAAPGLPGRLLAFLWPALVLGAAALLGLRGLRRGWAAPGPRRRAAGGAHDEEEEKEEEEEEEEGDGPAGAGGWAAGAVPARQPAEERRTAQVPVNGQLVTSVNIREKKLLKPKKRRKAQCSDKELPKDLLAVEKDKLQEEEGVWQTKISSREKRHLRKERLKQKDPSRAPLGSSAVEPGFDWDEKGAVWPLTENTSGSGKGALVAKAECGTALKASGAIREESVPSQLEEDVFSNVGTWDIAEVKSYTVTFGMLSELSRELDNTKGKSSEDSPSRCCWHASSTFLPVDNAWQGQDDPSAIDLDSDWKAPTEEWGNWMGDEEHQRGDKKEKDLPKGKAGIHFCLSGLESKTQRKKKKIEVKEARGGTGLRHPQQGLETRTEEAPRDLVSTKHSGDAVCSSFKKSLDVANNSPTNSVPGKKERRKRKKMKKET
ncbi:protein LYRIC-like isoform X2 [Phalacrocorax carbo]|uniref:protein LYRIC-like isoform X2 n=1 Tax=Phalacrocorax carbo TaxID=9209 RepID=UPI00311A0A76